MYEHWAVKGVDLAADSTQLRADASPDRTITREQLPEVAKVHRTVREYVERVERENLIAEPDENCARIPENAPDVMRPE